MKASLLPMGLVCGLLLAAQPAAAQDPSVLCCTEHLHERVRDILVVLPPVPVSDVPEVVEGEGNDVAREWLAGRGRTLQLAAQLHALQRAREQSERLWAAPGGEDIPVLSAALAQAVRDVPSLAERVDVVAIVGELTLAKWHQQDPPDLARQRLADLIQPLQAEASRATADQLLLRQALIAQLEGASDPWSLVLLGDLHTLHATAKWGQHRPQEPAAAQIPQRDDARALGAYRSAATDDGHPAAASARYRAAFLLVDPVSVQADEARGLQELESLLETAPDAAEAGRARILLGEASLGAGKTERALALGRANLAADTDRQASGYLVQRACLSEDPACTLRTFEDAAIGDPLLPDKARLASQALLGILLDDSADFSLTSWLSRGDRGEMELQLVVATARAAGDRDPWLAAQVLEAVVDRWPGDPRAPVFALMAALHLGEAGELEWFFAALRRIDERFGRDSEWRAMQAHMLEPAAEEAITEARDRLGHPARFKEPGAAAVGAPSYRLAPAHAVRACAAAATSAFRVPEGRVEVRWPPGQDPVVVDAVHDAELLACLRAELAAGRPNPDQDDDVIEAVVFLR